MVLFAPETWTLTTFGPVESSLAALNVNDGSTVGRPVAAASVAVL
jgi:hypothetical protein